MLACLLRLHGRSAHSGSFSKQSIVLLAGISRYLDGYFALMIAQMSLYGQYKPKSNRAFIAVFRRGALPGTQRLL